MIAAAALALCALAVAATALPLLLPRAKAWWIRILDFPRPQVAGLATLGCAGALLAGSDRLVLPALAAVAALHQVARVWRYTPFAPREVQASRGVDPAARLSLVVSNLLQHNRDAERALRTLRATDATLILCLEADDWWRERLDALGDTHPHALRCPLSNTYGMLLYSRLPLEEPSIDFLIQDDVPSMQAHVRLPSGARVWVHGVHPRPPVPGESGSSVERDAELVVVARRVQGARTPVVVFGDLNDVAWSRTTRLFQQLGGLVDPRKGRGFYGTFPARLRLLRVALDHVFHSPDFRLVEMRVLPRVGSDHLPVYVALSHEPQAERVQQAPASDADAEQEARETVAEAQAAERARGEERPRG